MRKKVMKKTIRNISAITPILFIGFCTNALAGDDAVNCRDDSNHQAPLFGYEAACTAEIDGIAEDLSTYVEPQLEHSVTLSKKVDFDGKSVELSCNADLDIVDFVDITQVICDYTPKASISYTRIGGSASASVYMTATDRDGVVIKKELWVDGVKQSGTTVQLSGNTGDTFHIVGKVTDNDGYTDETERTILLLYKPDEKCGEFFC